MRVIINPGSGPIEGRVSISSAHRNMRALLKACGYHDAKYDEDDSDADGGRYRFWVHVPKNKNFPKGRVSVDMPGCTLEVLQASVLIAPRLQGSTWTSLRGGGSSPSAGSRATSAARSTMAKSDDEPKLPDGPLLEIVDTDEGRLVTVHGPNCGRTQEIKQALETGEKPRAPWESDACKGPAMVNSKKYRDNYDSIFGKKLPRGEA